MKVFGSYVSEPIAGPVNWIIDRWPVGLFVLGLSLGAWTVSSCHHKRPGEIVIRVEKSFSDGVTWCKVTYADGGTKLSFSARPDAKCDLAHVPK
jgi:hypothetical protein